MACATKSRNEKPAKMEFWEDKEKRGRLLVGDRFPLNHIDLHRASTIKELRESYRPIPAFRKSWLYEEFSIAAIYVLGLFFFNTFDGQNYYMEQPNPNLDNFVRGGGNFDEINHLINAKEYKRSVEKNRARGNENCHRQSRNRNN